MDASLSVMMESDLEAGRETLQYLATEGERIIKALRQAAEPKDLRTYTIGEVATLINKSTSLIRKREREGTFPAALRDGRNDRVYTLEMVLQIMQAMGLRARRPGPDPVVIAYINYKGGPGKTTGAVHTAQCLALRGYRVLVVDSDPQGSTTSQFWLQGVDPLDCKSIRYGLVPIDDQDDLFPGHDFQQDLCPLVRKTHWPNIDIIPANPELHDVEFEMQQFADPNQNRLPWGRLKAPLLRTARMGADLNESDPGRFDYDVIIVDGQPHLSLLTLAMVDAADIMMLPCRMSGHDVASTITFASKLLSYVEPFLDRPVTQGRFSLPRFVRHLPTQLDSSSAIEAYNLNICRAGFGGRVMGSPILKSDALKYSGNSGAFSVFEDDSKYPGAHETALRARQIIEAHVTELEALMKLFWDEQGRTVDEL